MPAPSTTRLVCDAMLGRLTTYLRMCGYDTVYAPDRGVEADDAVAALAADEDRTLLTRDRDLAARVQNAVLLTNRDIEGQLQELLEAEFELSLSTPTRCSRCNGSLTRVSAATRTPADVPDPATTKVWTCEDCGHRFWQGSHWDDVGDRLDTLETGPG